MLVVHTPQVESAPQAVVLLGQTLSQSAAFVHDEAVPIAHLPPVFCSGQLLLVVHCLVVRLPVASLHNE